MRQLVCIAIIGASLVARSASVEQTSPGTKPPPEVVATIDRDRELANLSSAIRLFVLGFYRSRLAERRGELAPPSESAINR